MSAKCDAVRKFYRLMLPIRFSFLTLIVFAVALLFTDRDQIDLQMGLRSGENGQHVKDIANVLGVTPRNDTVWQEAWDRERLARRNERK